jgi:hypothetical protein
VKFRLLTVIAPSSNLITISVWEWPPREVGSITLFDEEMKKIKISKLDAARRQMLTAIRLYFNHGDIVSMHTLAAAAFKITQNICDASPDLSDSVTDWIDQCVKPEAKKIFWSKLHETANFFKHAENDPDAVHEFYPEQTENLLFFAVYQYHQLTSEWSLEIRLFITWYMMHHSSSFNTPPELSHLGTDLFGSDRNRFWRVLLPLVQETTDKGISEP